MHESKDLLLNEASNAAGTVCLPQCPLQAVVQLNHAGVWSAPLSLQHSLLTAQSSSNSTHGCPLWFHAFDLNLFCRPQFRIPVEKPCKKKKKNPPSCQLAHHHRHRLLEALRGDAIRTCEPVVTRWSLVLINNELPEPSSYLSSSFLGGLSGMNSTAWIYILFIYLFCFRDV